MASTELTGLHGFNPGRCTGNVNAVGLEVSQSLLSIVPKQEDSADLSGEQRIRREGIVQT